MFSPVSKGKPKVVTNSIELDTKDVSTRMLGLEGIVDCEISIDCREERVPTRTRGEL